MADLIGKFRQMAVDKETHEALVTFAIRTDLGDLEEQSKKWGEKDLSISIKKFSPDHSNEANSKFHVLCREIGKHPDIGQSETFIKNMMVCRYGQEDLTNNGDRWIINTNQDVSDMWEQEQIHLKPIGIVYENGQQLYSYAVMRGVHTYTRAEMSQLISGTVDEARDLGIPTISDKDMEKILNAWGKQ